MAKRMAISAFFLIFSLASVERGWAKNSPASPRIPILMYHYIGPLPPTTDRLGRGLTVTAEHFAAQLDTLKRLGFEAIDFEELHGGKLPGKPIILTFDDGYEDAYTDALSTLKSHRMRGVFFIVTGFVGKPGYMTWEQILKMKSAGMSFGAHTLDHRNLASLPMKMQKEEIDGSVAELQRQLRVPIHAFAYPSGRYSRSTLNIVKDEGLWYAVTTHEGIATMSGDSLQLPRIRVKDSTPLQKMLARI